MCTVIRIISFNVEAVVTDVVQNFGRTASLAPFKSVFLVAWTGQHFLFGKNNVFVISLN